MFLRLGTYPHGAKVLDVTDSHAYPKDLKEYAGYIITGSLSMVTEKPSWSLRLQKFIELLHKENAPFLGVCYGHQIVAQALGGEVDYNPLGCEIGTHTVSLNAKAREHPLFSSIPEKFPANLSHSQTVVKTPLDAVVLGSSASDPNQILSYGGLKLTVQFHPEFDGKVMQGFHQAAVKARTVKSHKKKTIDHTPSPKRKLLPLIEGIPIIDTPESQDILNSFIRLSSEEKVKISS
jgi:GMP synthase (glutamine-hydrolysing)